jgi:hypothetical protein
MHLARLFLDNPPPSLCSHPSYSFFYPFLNPFLHVVGLDHHDIDLNKITQENIFYVGENPTSLHTFITFYPLESGKI